MTVMRIVRAEDIDALVDALERLLVSHRLIYEDLPLKEFDGLLMPRTPHHQMIVVRQARKVLANVRGER